MQAETIAMQLHTNHITATPPQPPTHRMLPSSTATPASSSTSRASACSRVSPSSRKPARVLYLEDQGGRKGGKGFEVVSVSMERGFGTVQCSSGLCVGVLQCALCCREGLQQGCRATRCACRTVLPLLLTCRSASPPCAPTGTSHCQPSPE